MAWLVLVVSGVLETAWAAALSASHGFSRLLPTVVFAAALVLSMAGLAYALRRFRSARDMRFGSVSARPAPRLPAWSRSASR